ncbi:hypothetical protein [Streptomyces sp. cg40]|uniref:hypothetical protein n=1 Tax=Streptomyces sp. cg40 TaxID=3419764 RepID=UPI003D06DD30
MHHELGSGLGWLSGYLVGAGVSVAVHGGLPVSVDTAAESVAITIGVFLVLALLHASGLRWVSMNRHFRAAGPLPSDVQIPRSTPWSGPVIIVFLPPCVMTYFWLADSLFLLLLPVDSLALAAAAFWWERRHSRLIWQGPFKNNKHQLAYSPLSPPPPTRTATDAPPA